MDEFWGKYGKIYAPSNISFSIYTQFQEVKEKNLYNKYNYSQYHNKNFQTKINYEYIKNTSVGIFTELYTYDLEKAFYIYISYIRI